MDAVRNEGALGISPHFNVHILDDRQVLLLSEQRSFRLTGRLYVALVPYLDGTCTYDEIFEAFRERAPEDKLRFALDNMLTKGYAVRLSRTAPRERQALWVEMGLAPDDAEMRIAGARVALVARGEGPGARAADIGRVAEALAGAGLTVVPGEDADLTLVLVDDYLQFDMEEFNADMLRRSRRWLPFKPAGGQALIGPVFGGAGEPCWMCVAKRMRENRPGDNVVTEKVAAVRPARAQVPASLGLAYNLAAIEIARFLAQGDEAELSRNLLSLNLKERGFRSHPVVAQPWCPACGAAYEAEARLQEASRPIVFETARALVQTDGGWRVAKAEDVVHRLERHVSPITGMIADVERKSLAEGVSVYVARQSNAQHVSPRLNRRLGRPFGAAGKGISDIQAKVSCLAEAVERYCCGWTGTEPRRRARFEELGGDALHPHRLLNYSPAQYAIRESWNEKENGFNWVAAPFDEGRGVDWTPAWSLSERRVRWLPTRFCYFDYFDPEGSPDSKEDNPFCRSDSNGCASGSTLEEAVLQGFFELVERDACALWWYNRVQVPGIDLASFRDPYFDRIRAFYDGLGRELVALDLTHDLGIPTVMALAYKRTDGSKIVLGLGTHLDGRIAIARALSELTQMTTIDEDLPEETGDLKGDERTYFDWLMRATTKNQPYVLPKPGTARTAADFPPYKVEGLGRAIDHCIEILRGRGLEMIVLDKSRPEVAFSCARVVVPGMRHFWARLAPGRLYDVPVDLGWLDRPKAEEDLNPIPFFL